MAQNYQRTRLKLIRGTFCFREESRKANGSAPFHSLKILALKKASCRNTKPHRIIIVRISTIKINRSRTYGIFSNPAGRVSLVHRKIFMTELDVQFMRVIALAQKRNSTKTKAARLALIKKW